jgi:hypothetical protein
LVASTEKTKTLMPKLHGAILSEPKAAQPLDYVLITR